MILLPDKITAALKVLSSTLGEGVEWAVSGSLALALYGLPVVPKDIDLQTDRAGADAIARLLGAYQVYPPGLHLGVRLMRSYLGQYRVEGVVVEVMGDLEYQSVNGSWHNAPDFKLQRRTLEYLGISVPVVSLEYLHEFYLQLQRPARVALIEAKLEAQRTGGEGV
jgi:hypothetical protein